MVMRVAQAMKAAPIFAVLRGITPDEAVPIGAALVEAGITFLEATCDSPEIEKTLRILADRYSDRAVIAAGTVLSVDMARRAVAAGATLLVAPNFSPSVVAEANALGAASAPGVVTPSEAFAALETGASMLKVFPGDVMTPKAVKSLCAVLPKGVQIVVTGGIDAGNIPDYLSHGAAGVGVGSALYKPYKPAGAVREDAARFVEIAAKARA